MVASIRLLLYYYSVNRIFEIVNKINIKGSVRKDEDMKLHTTFKCGGPADIFVTAEDISDILTIKKIAVKHKEPLFILGGGANLLVSDKGIRGITLSLESFKKYTIEDSLLIAESGISVNEISEIAQSKSLSGLEFIYGMPGSLGGAVWMNARCYGSEISEIFVWAEYISEHGTLEKIYFNEQDWDYKISPFQKDGIIITKIALKLKKADKSVIKETMLQNKSDREVKGHYSYPCAGSVFKNNRNFGSPSGKIIEDAGLKGLTKGGAQVSTFHGNIIINKNNATAMDISYLIDKVIEVVYEKTGFILEPEVLKVGEWD